MSQWGCWNTYYVAPTYNTMGHVLMLNDDRGAAAVLGAGTLTDSSSDIGLGEQLVPRIATPGKSIGSAYQGRSCLATRTGIIFRDFPFSLPSIYPTQPLRSTRLKRLKRRNST